MLVSGRSARQRIRPENLGGNSRRSGMTSQGESRVPPANARAPANPARRGQTRVRCKAQALAVHTEKHARIEEETMKTSTRITLAALATLILLDPCSALWADEPKNSQPQEREATAKAP